MHRFVRESESHVETAPTKRIPKKYRVTIEDGQTARSEYEKILQMPSTTTAASAAATANQREPKKRRTRQTTAKNPKNVPFDRNQLFRAATTNDPSTIEQMKIPSPMLINACDQFGWTALMMAAFEGHLDVIKVLVRLGANINIETNQNESAITLAERAKRHEAAAFLKQSLEPICLSDSDDEDDDNNDTSSTKTKIYFCDICKMEIAIGDRKSHETSTLHRFNRSDSKSDVPRFGIPESNIGYQMLVQQGWRADNGLGPQQNGQMYPIKTTLRKPRSGLGVRQPSKAKVTHFKPFDCDAIKSKTARPISAANIAVVKTKRQIRNEKLRAQRKDRYLRKLLS